MVNLVDYQITTLQFDFVTPHWSDLHLFPCLLPVYAPVLFIFCLLFILYALWFIPDNWDLHPTLPLSLCVWLVVGRSFTFTYPGRPILPKRVVAPYLLLPLFHALLILRFPPALPQHDHTLTSGPDCLLLPPSLLPTPSFACPSQMPHTHLPLSSAPITHITYTHSH